MYNPNDTIAAISSPAIHESEPAATIIRLSGDHSCEILKPFNLSLPKKPGLRKETIRIEGIEADVIVYFYPKGRSYTGEPIIEFHLTAARPLVEAFFDRILTCCRLADPGEFTLRAYMNGKMDLSQAEAVAEVISSSNRLQLEAAEHLLEGKLCDTIGEIRKHIWDVISLIEAGMDFSTEDISFISHKQAISRIQAIESELNGLLADQVQCEELIGLCSVGLVGAANAGKSTLLNTLLQSQRSIVSNETATTRDVLTGVMKMEKASCAMFDCAGLMRQSENLLDELAREAALETISSATIICFCVDLSKQDLAEEEWITTLLKGKDVIVVGTKADLADTPSSNLAACCDPQWPMISISAATGTGIEKLRQIIESKVIQAGKYREADEQVAMTQRHRSVIKEAIVNIHDAAEEMAAGNEEVVVMFLRNAADVLAGIEKEDVDQEVLGRIFSKFCIGK